MFYQHDSGVSMSKILGSLLLQIGVVLLFCHKTTESSFGKDPDAPLPVELSENVKIVEQITEKLLSPEGLNQRDIPSQVSSELHELIKDTFSSSSAKRAEAAEKIGRLKERAILAIPFLIRLLDDNKSYREEYYLNHVISRQVDELAIDALVKIGKPAVGPCLLVAKHPSESRLFAESLVVLGLLKDSRAIDPMLLALKSSNRMIRFRTINAIDCNVFVYRYQAIPWNDPKFLVPLLDALHDEEVMVRQSAAWALGAHQDTRSTEALLDILDDKYVRPVWHQVRNYAIQSLAKHKDHRVIPALLNVLHSDKVDDAQSWLRRQAAISLGEIGDHKIIDELFTVVKNTSLPSEVRQGAILGVVASKDKRCVVELQSIALSKDEPWKMRAFLLEAIERLQGEKSLPLLTTLALSTDEQAELQCRAAMQVISLKKGAINDPKLLASFDEGFIRDDGSYYLGARSMRLVIKNGENETVKNLAKEQLKRWDEPEKFPTETDWGIRIVEMDCDSRSLRLRPAPN